MSCSHVCSGIYELKQPRQIVHGPKHFVFICFFLRIQSSRQKRSQMEMEGELRKDATITDVLQAVLDEHVICAGTCKPLIDLGQGQKEDRLLEDESVTSKVQIKHNQRSCLAADLNMDVQMFQSDLLFDHFSIVCSFL